MDLIASTERGLYCAAGDFHIDPWRPVPRAIITHAHSDHARFGSDVYVCHRDTAPILRKRLGDVMIEKAEYGQILTRNGVEISFHPAGHVLGSAQVRVASKGEIWVASGDYKLESDGVALAFEPLRCHAFITESTFGLPIYRWRPQAETFASIDAWRRENITAGRASILQMALIEPGTQFCLCCSAVAPTTDGSSGRKKSPDFHWQFHGGLY